MDQDRNLLFGVFAVQLKRVSASEIMSAAAAWAAEPSQPLAERLVANRALSVDDCQFLDRLVNEAIDSHDGDTAATLAALGGAHLVEDTFAQSIILTDSGDVKIRPAGKDGEESPSEIEAINEPEGRYVNEIEHARGGMGRVLFVHDSFLERDIALKEIRPPSNGAADSTDKAHGSGSLLNRFLREAKITGQLEHPSIVPVYELGHRQDGTLYYTMKLVRGRTLSAAFKEAKDLGERLHLLPHFLNLCQAIAYAHSRKVIHRDIKPANVMIGEFGETVVIDWGLAKVKDHEDDFHIDPLDETVRSLRSGDDTPMTAYGEVMGTPAYMPPEQAKGQLDQIDERSDLYSLGTVLYELLTGVPPYSGKSTAEILAKVVDAKPAPINSHARNAPSELVAICMRAISPHPHDRYHSVMELADEIRRFQTGNFVKVYRYNARDYVARFVKRNSTLVATSATAILIVIGITAFFSLRMVQTNTELSFSNQELALASNEALQQSKEAETQRILAERRSYFAGLLLARTLIDDRDFDEARLALEETPIDYRGWEWGYLLNRCTAHEMTIATPLRGLASALYAKGGREVIAIQSDSTFTAWDAKTGEAIRDEIAQDSTLKKVIESADRQTIATIAQMPDVTSQVWDAQSGTLTGQLGNLAMPAINDGDLSPDGKQLVSISVGRTAVIWDLETFSDVHILNEHHDAIACVDWSPDGHLIATGANDGSVILWDPLTGHAILTLEKQSRAITRLWFTPDSRSVITHDETGTLISWSVDSGHRETSFTNTNSLVTTLSFLEDEATFITASSDGIVRLWDGGTGTIHTTYAGHTASVLDIAISPDGKTLASASRDRSVNLWDRITGELIHTFEGHSDAVQTVEFDQGGNNILTSSSDRSVRTWAVAANQRRTRNTINAHEGRARGIKWTDNSNRFTTFGDDGIINMWNADTMSQEYVLCDACRFGLDDYSTANDDQLLALACDSQVVLFDSNDLENPRTINGDFIDIQLSPEGDRLLCVTGHGEIRIFDTSSGELLLDQVGHEYVIWQTFYFPDGKSFVTVSNDNTAKRWDAVTGDLITTYEGHTDEVLRGTISHDGKFLLTASADQSAIIWNINSGEIIKVLADHPAKVTAVEFSPHGHRVATGTLDGQIHIWDPTEGVKVATLTLNADAPESAQKFPVLSLRWSPDGRTLGVGFSDGQLGTLYALPWEPGESSKVSSGFRPVNAVAPAKAQAIDIVAITSRVVYRIRALRDMARASDGFQNDAQELVVDKSIHARSLQRMGMIEGDRIESVDGQPLTPTTFDAQMNSMIEELRANDPQTHEFKLDRNGRKMTMRTHFIMPKTEEEIVHIGRQEVTQILMMLSIGIKNYDGVFRDMQHIAAARGLGLYLNEEDMAGALIAGFDTPTEADETFRTLFFGIMEKLGIKRNDRIIAIDGAYVDDMSDVYAILDDMVAQARTSKGGQIDIEVERGSYRHVRIVLEFEL